MQRALSRVGSGEFWRTGVLPGVLPSEAVFALERFEAATAGRLQTRWITGGETLSHVFRRMASRGL